MYCYPKNASYIRWIHHQKLNLAMHFLQYLVIWWRIHRVYPNICCIYILQNINAAYGVQEDMKSPPPPITTRKELVRVCNIKCKDATYYSPEVDLVKRCLLFASDAIGSKAINGDLMMDDDGEKTYIIRFFSSSSSSPSSSSSFLSLILLLLLLLLLSMTVPTCTVAVAVGAVGCVGGSVLGCVW